MDPTIKWELYGGCILCNPHFFKEVNMSEKPQSFKVSLADIKRNAKLIHEQSEDDSASEKGKNGQEL